VDADGVLLVAHAPAVHHNAIVGPPAGGNNVAIGVLDSGSSSSNGSTPTTVSISGVTQPVTLAVSYSQNGAAQPTPTAVDTVVGLGLNGTKTSSSSLITSLAKSLLSGNGQAS
jgi:hypothetical protein